MASVFYNIRGTTENVFKLGKRGIDFLYKEVFPDNTEGNNGDVCILKESFSKLLINRNNVWMDIQSNNLINVAGDYTYLNQSSMDVLLCDTTVSTTVSIEVIPPEGHTFTIKDKSGNSSTNNIDITCLNGITIDGSSTSTINNDYTSITVMSDGVSLYLI